MEGIYCSYYDPGMEYCIPFQPTLQEAIEMFNGFDWENNKQTDRKIKLLVFLARGEHDVAVCISSLQKQRWHVSANTARKRRFFGPFFKKKINKLFVHIERHEVEVIIENIYTHSHEEFVLFLSEKA